MPIRIECTTPDLEHCFVEITDRWSRSDLTALFEAGQQPALWRRKVTACVLALASSDEVIADPAQLYDDEDNIHDDLDVRLLGFLSSALVLAADAVVKLGKKNARLSSAGSERA